MFPELELRTHPCNKYFTTGPLAAGAVWLSRTELDASVKQFGFEPMPKGLGAGVVVAVAASAHAMHCPVLREHGSKACGGVLAALVGMHHEPSRVPAHGQGLGSRLAHQGFGHELAQAPAHDFARVAVQLRNQAEPAAASLGQIRAVADLHAVGGGGNVLA